MPVRTFRTPLIAAFFCAAVSAGCAEDQTGSKTDYTRCKFSTTAIASIQGSRPASAMIDQQVTVQGVVTLIEAGHGIYLEEPGSDIDERTSNAIFVQSGKLSESVKQGSWISAQGKVAELRKGRNSLTALTDVSDIIQCSSGQDLPLTTVELPLGGLERESLEGMRIQPTGTLTVTDTYQLGHGKFSLAGNGFQFVATEILAPGSEAEKYQRINRNHTLPASFAKNSAHTDLLVSGLSVTDLSGVLTHDKRSLRVSVQSMSADSPSALTPPVQAGADELRVVGMNLLNFFNGDGKGGGFPTPRGAKTTIEYDHQRSRLRAAIHKLNPHVLAVMELENDGFGGLSAAADFIALVEQATGASWQASRPAGDDTGGDKITVGIFYRDDLLEVTGPARTLTGPEFKKSRQPMAQAFRQRNNDEKLLIVTNHLKSKGSCPDSGVDANQKDGQGCWNPIRTASAEKMTAWVKSLAATSQTDNTIILGDMNAYRQEDPINAIRAAGFIELMDNTEGTEYSYIYYGQAGTLDYAFVSEELLQQVQQAFIWHVNAAFPAKMELPLPWLRFSDHDPVVIDIRLHQSATSD